MSVQSRLKQRRTPNRDIEDLIGTVPIITAFLKDVKEGNKIIKNAFERFNLPLKNGIIFKKRMPIPKGSEGKLTRSRLLGCFGMFVAAYDLAVKYFRILKLSMDRGDKSKLLKDLDKFAEAYWNIFRTLMSFSDDLGAIYRPECAEFKRFVKIAKDKTVMLFMINLMRSTALLQVIKDRELKDAEVEQIIVKFKAVLKFEGLENEELSTEEMANIRRRARLAERGQTDDAGTDSGDSDLGDDDHGEDEDPVLSVPHSVTARSPRGGAPRRSRTRRQR